MTKQELQAILQIGEGYKTEFKRNVNSDLSRELIAFANSSGGTIYIGIDDDGSVPGIKVTNELRSKVQMAARDCDPSVPIILEEFENILIIHVPEGKNKPYRCTSGFYMRNGASSVKLSTQEIIDFIKEEGRVRFEDLLPAEISYPQDVDDTVVKRYLRLANITGTLSTNDVLINLGVLHHEKSSLLLNNAGVLFFNKEPTKYLRHTIIRCLLFRGIDKAEILDDRILDKDLLSNIDQAVTFVKEHTYLSYVIKTVRRQEVPELPEEAIREAIINAAAHRDYFERGANIMVEVYNDRVEIWNPGGLAKGFDISQFGKQTFRRNPIMVDLLQRVSFVEKAGTGIWRMRKAMTDRGLAEPTFELGNFFGVIFERTHNDHLFEGKQELLQDIYSEVSLRKQGLNERQIKAVLYVKENGRITNMIYQQIATTSERTATRDLKELVFQNIFEQVGKTGKGTEYLLSRH